MNRHRPRLGAVIFGTALLLRVAWVLLGWCQAGPELSYPDEELHWQLARNLVERAALVTADGRYAARMPLYPLFLSVFAGAGDTGILLARLMQALIGAATAWVAYAFVNKVLGRRAAIVAGLLVSIDPYAVFFANLLLTEVLFSLLAVALTACVGLLVLDLRDGAQSGDPNPERQRRAVALLTEQWHTHRNPERQRGASGNAATIGVALLGAAALMTRPAAFGWILLLWLLIWWLSAPRVVGARRVALCLAVLLACLLPWGLRNRADIGSWAWLSTNGGVTLYDAQGPQADGSSNQAFLGRMPQLAGLGEVERDRRLRRLALQQMQRDPARVLKLAWVEFLRTWSPVPHVAEYHGGATGAVSAVFTGAVLLAAFVGLARCLWPARTRNRSAGSGGRASRRTAAQQELRPPQAATRQELYPSDDGPADSGNGCADQSRAREPALACRRLHLLLWLPVVYFTLVHCIFVGSLRYRVPLMPFLEVAAATALLRTKAGGTGSARA